MFSLLQPFVDEDQVYIHALFPDRKFAVALPLLAGVLGLAVIGNLMFNPQNFVLVERYAKKDFLYK